MADKGAHLLFSAAGRLLALAGTTLASSHAASGTAHESAQVVVERSIEHATTDA